METPVTSPSSSFLHHKFIHLPPAPSFTIGFFLLSLCHVCHAPICMHTLSQCAMHCELLDLLFLRRIICKTGVQTSKNQVSRSMHKMKNSLVCVTHTGYTVLVLAPEQLSTQPPVQTEVQIQARGGGETQAWGMEVFP